MLRRELTASLSRWLVMLEPFSSVSEKAPIAFTSSADTLRGRPRPRLAFGSAFGASHPASPSGPSGPDGQVVARGLTNYSSAELPLMLGRSTKEIAADLGPEYEREAIHRDHLAVHRP